MAEKRTIGNRPGLFQKTAPESTERLKTSSESNAPLKSKATYYLTIADLQLLDDIQGRLWKQTGEKPDKSSLIARAIHLLEEQVKQ